MREKCKHSNQNPNCRLCLNDKIAQLKSSLAARDQALMIAREMFEIIADNYTQDCPSSFVMIAKDTIAKIDAIVGREGNVE